MSGLVSSDDYDVTVVMAVKNESKHIKEAIVSIVNQLGLKVELIIIDDGSQDNTIQIISEFLVDYNNVKFFLNPNKGKVSAFNYGVQKSSAPFVCLFAGDDVMPSGSLSIRFEDVKNQSIKYAVAGISKIRTMSDDPRFDKVIVPKRKGEGNLSGQSPLMNKTMVKKMFPVPEQLPNEDTWMELFMTYIPDLRIISNDVICCDWRIHEGNTYNLKKGYYDYKNAVTQRSVQGFELFYSKYKDIIPAFKLYELEKCIKCNRSYKEGSVFGILFSGAPLKHRLRMLSTSTHIIFKLRMLMHNIIHYSKALYFVFKLPKNHY